MVISSSASLFASKRGVIPKKMIRMTVAIPVTAKRNLLWENFMFFRNFRLSGNENFFKRLLPPLNPRLDLKSLFLLIPVASHLHLLGHRGHEFHFLKERRFIEERNQIRS